MQLNLPGGGGYGDPFTRDPEAVLWDVIEGYVSIDAARRDFGSWSSAWAETTNSSASRTTTASIRRQPRYPPIVRPRLGRVHAIRIDIA